MNHGAARMVEVQAVGSQLQNPGSRMPTLSRTRSSELVRAAHPHQPGVEIVRFATVGGPRFATTDGSGVVMGVGGVGSGFATVGGGNELRVLGSTTDCALKYDTPPAFGVGKAFAAQLAAEPVCARRIEPCYGECAQAYRAQPTTRSSLRTVQAESQDSGPGDELRELRRAVGVLTQRLETQQVTIDSLLRTQSELGRRLDVEEICDRVQTRLGPTLTHGSGEQQRLQQDMMQTVMKELLQSARENRSSGLRRERHGSETSSASSSVEKSCMEKLESRMAAMEKDILARMVAVRQDVASLSEKVTANVMREMQRTLQQQKALTAPPEKQEEKQQDRQQEKQRPSATPSTEAQPRKQETKRRQASPPRAKNPSKPESVIFLDIDGVLHSLYGEDVFRETCCNLLERIVKKTGAAIVLTSTWRRDSGKVHMINNMLARRLITPIFDCTREVSDGKREAEICDWLDRHPWVCNWIAIDDMDLQSSDTEQARRMRGHVVHTNADTGLTVQDAERALALLQGRLPSSVKACSVATPSTVSSATTVASFTPATTSRAHTAHTTAVSTPVALTPAATSRIASPVRSGSITVSPPGQAMLSLAAATPPAFARLPSPPAWRLASPSRTPGRGAYTRQLRGGASSPPASSRSLLCSPHRSGTTSSRSLRPVSMSIPLSASVAPVANTTPSMPAQGQVCVTVQ